MERPGGREQNLHEVAPQGVGFIAGSSGPSTLPGTTTIRWPRSRHIASPRRINCEPTPCRWQPGSTAIGARANASTVPPLVSIGNRLNSRCPITAPSCSANGYKGPMWDAWQTQSLAWLAELKFIPVESEKK